MKFSIEITSAKNEQLLYQPTAEILRGRWEIINTAGRSFAQDFGKVPGVIPGIQLHLDGAKRKFTKFEPLSEGEGKEILDRYNEIAKKVPQLREGRAEATVVEGGPAQSPLSEDRLKTHAYWMLRAVMSGNARVIDGTTAPKMDDVMAMPGTIEKERFAPSQLRSTKQVESAPAV